MLSGWYFGSDLPTWALLAELLVAGLIVIVSGGRLTLLADKIADEYHLSGAWVGALLLASITSLPEMVTGCTAVWIGQTDMAFAAIFGSCSFNIVLIVLFNACVGGGSILRGKGGSHTLSSAFGIVLMSLALLAILIVGKFEAQPRLAQTLEIAFVTIIAFTYVSCMRMVFRADAALSVPAADAVSPQRRTPGLLRNVALLALVLVLTAWWLARTGDVLADHPIEMIGGPLGATFVGVLFLAIATSLPEIATGLAAVRIGNLDMALGNIFGSNMFNMCVIPMLKVSAWCSGDSLLMAGEDFHASQNIIAGLLPILLTGVVVGGLSYPSPRTLLKRFGRDSGLIAAIYVVGMYLLLRGA